MYFAMCADAGMLLGILLFYLLGAAICCGACVMVFVLIAKWTNARREWPASESLPEAKPGSNLGL